MFEDEFLDLTDTDLPLDCLELGAVASDLQQQHRVQALAAQRPDRLQQLETARRLSGGWQQEMASHGSPRVAPVSSELEFRAPTWRPLMASISIHSTRPESTEGPITGFAFTIEYAEGKASQFRRSSHSAEFRCERARSVPPGAPATGDRDPRCGWFREGHPLGPVKRLMGARSVVASEGLIPVAGGRNIRQVMPVSGSFSNMTGSFQGLFVEITVEL
jgi:hypothetical protein